MQIEKGERPGTYNVTFSTANKQITFETYPILPQEDYEKALAKYKEEKAKADRIRDSIQKAIELERQRIEEQNRLIAQRVNNFYTTVEINEFGVWNCDNPMLAEGRRLPVTFVDKNNKAITPAMICMVYKKYNAMFQIYDNKIILVPKTQVMIVGIDYETNKVYYLSYRDFQELNLSSTGKQTIKLKEESFEKFDNPQKLLEV